jgi:ribosomal-protein-alanine N-acetyltransferase
VPGRPPRDAFLIGQRIYLRALRDEDADGPYAGWFNDEEVCRGNSHHVHPYTREAALAYIRDTHARKDSLVLAIAMIDGAPHVGNVALQRIDPVARSAEFAIVIGEREAWGKGVGKEAAGLIFRHGFSALNLNRIHCGTLDSNEAMRRIALALGMREEGRRREAAFKDGRFVDCVEFGVLRAEFLRGTTPEPAQS